MLSYLTSVHRSGVIFACALLLYYGLFPLALYLLDLGNDYFWELAKLCAIAGAFVFLGFKVPLLSRNLFAKAGKISISENSFFLCVWIAFIAFALVAWGTAEKIPLIASFEGADEVTLAILREQFLKARVGWQQAFVYINALLTGALVPFALAVMFYRHAPFRWLCLAIFLVYCLSFLEKVYFLKALLPLLYLAAHGHTKLLLGRKGLVVSGVLLLLLTTYLSGAGTGRDADEFNFLSLQYAPQGSIEHIVWRALVVPVLTAADALRVFHEWLNSELQWGATSSLLAGVFGMERIPFERLVFFAQWGQNETESGSSNSVFVTEAYVNFGYVGVALFSYFIGSTLKLISSSDNVPLQSLWLLLCMGVFTAGLIGTLASNGFLGLLIFCAFFRLIPRHSVSDLPSPVQAYRTCNPKY